MALDLTYFATRQAKIRSSSSAKLGDTLGHRAQFLGAGHGRVAGLHQQAAGDTLVFQQLLDGNG